MKTIEVHKDVENATLRVVSEYEAKPERIWRLWADPRQLERWWGPPGYPATVTEHDLVPGGTVAYYMTSPEGERYHGGWRVVGVDAPNRIRFEDFFADDSGTENADMPLSRSTVSIDDVGAGRTRMEIESTYESAEAMQKVLEMGMEEGIKAAAGQIDALLAESD